MFEIIQSIFFYNNGMTLEIKRRETKISTNTWKLNNTLINNQWIEEETIREIKKYFELNENESTTYQNLWDAVKTVLREKVTTINPYI